MPIWIRVQNLRITGWIITKKEQLTKINIGSEENLQHVKINVDVGLVVNYQMIELLKWFKDIFAWTYKDLKGIPHEIAHHQIKLDKLIPLTHQASYRLNPNHATIVKHNINKLFVTWFINLLKRLLNYHL
jgi:hypothetical protein